MKILIIFASCVFLISLGLYTYKKCTVAEMAFATNNKGGNMEITSIFKNNERIPSKYTCDGEGTGPELTISGTPSNAKTLVLIIDDPDAPMGTFTHYLLFNIKPEITKILPSEPENGAVEGINDFKQTSYGAPCPPYGSHRRSE